MFLCQYLAVLIITALKKKRLLLVIIKKMQIETTVSCHLTPVRMAIYQKDERYSVLVRK